MNLAPSSNLPFPTGDNYYPVNYYGPTKPTAPSAHHLPMFGDGHGPSFKDVLDIINPLQHIPIVSTIYQDLTGDVPGVAARIAGGALYGGPIGAAGAFINTAVDEGTGKTIGEYVVSAVEDLFSGSSSGSSGSKTELAAAQTNPSKTAANSNDAGKSSDVAAVKPVKAPVQVATASIPAANNLVVAEASAMAPVHPPAVTSAPLAPADATAVAKVAAAKLAAPTPNLHAFATAGDNKMMALRGSKPHFMPVPARHHFDPVQPPMIAVPLSTNGEQSNVPIVGEYHAPAYVPPTTQTLTAPIAATPASTNPATESQPKSLPTAAVSQDMATVKKGEAGSWFTSAMMQNLHKYQKMNELTKTHVASTGASKT